MITVEYIKMDGSSTAVKAVVGQNLMMVAVNNGIHGIIGECGGSVMCATCHVYVHEQDLDKFEEITSLEQEMLEGAVAETKETSRLSCQLVLQENVESVRVYLPDE